MLLAVVFSHWLASRSRRLTFKPLHGLVPEIVRLRSSSAAGYRNGESVARKDHVALAGSEPQAGAEDHVAATRSRHSHGRTGRTLPCSLDREGSDRLSADAFNTVLHLSRDDGPDEYGRAGLELALNWGWRAATAGLRPGIRQGCEAQQHRTRPDDRVPLVDSLPVWLKACG